MEEGGAGIRIPVLRGGSGIVYVAQVYPGYEPTAERQDSEMDVPVRGRDSHGSLLQSP